VQSRLLSVPVCPLSRHAELQVYEKRDRPSVVTRRRMTRTLVQSRWNGQFSLFSAVVVANAQHGKENPGCLEDDGRGLGWDLRLFDWLCRSHGELPRCDLLNNYMCLLWLPGRPQYSMYCEEFRKERQITCYAFDFLTRRTTEIHSQVFYL
jgi:uncharacterized protein YbaR (Trm112 family)